MSYSGLRIHEARILSLTVTGRVSQAVLNTSRGARAPADRTLRATVRHARRGPRRLRQPAHRHRRLLVRLGQALRPVRLTTAATRYAAASLRTVLWKFSREPSRARGMRPSAGRRGELGVHELHVAVPADPAERRPQLSSSAYVVSSGACVVSSRRRCLLRCSGNLRRERRNSRHARRNLRHEPRNLRHACPCSEYPPRTKSPR